MTAQSKNSYSKREESGHSKERLDQSQIKIQQGNHQTLPASGVHNAINWASKVWPAPLPPPATHTVSFLSQLHSMPAALLSGHPMVLVSLISCGLHCTLDFGFIQCLPKGSFWDPNPAIQCLAPVSLCIHEQNSMTPLNLYFLCLTPVPRGQCCQVLLPALDATRPPWV